MFFIGYFLFEVPSNLILHRVGARLWIGRIMITWGLVSALFMFTTTPAMFYSLRFLLGVAEAGFFPGIILYLTYWYPAERRVRMIALFMTAVPIAGVVGSPLSGWIMESFAGVLGWAGWQWLFLLEAVPAIVMGVGGRGLSRQRHQIGVLADGGREERSSSASSSRIAQRSLRIRRYRRCLPTGASGSCARSISAM